MPAVLKMYWPLKITEAQKKLYHNPVDGFNCCARVTAMGLTDTYGFYGFTGRATEVQPLAGATGLAPVTVFMEVVQESE